jgi:hypothetical protein
VSEEKAAWLKRMENGQIGEVRTKAILIDRFWILERNVDINGADLLIQRQILKEDFNDPKPGKLGIVQAKFRQSLPATIEIKKEYFLFRDQPRKNFFLFVHTGTEDNQKIFFYTSEEIMKSVNNNCELTVNERTKEAVSSTKEVLSTIEKMMESMNIQDNYLSIFDNNRERSYYHSDSSNTTRAALSPEYDVFIPEVGSFKEIVEKARDIVDHHVSNRIEPLLENQKKMNFSTTPIDVLVECEDFASESNLREHFQDLNDAIKKFNELKENALDVGLLNFCAEVAEHTKNHYFDKDELLSESRCYKIELKASNFLKVPPWTLKVGSIVATPLTLTEEITSHVQSEKDRLQSWRESPFYRAFIQRTFKPGEIEIVVNLSQSRSAARVRYLLEQVKEEASGKIIYGNSKVELDKAKGDLLQELIDIVLRISVNRIFADIDLQ